MFCAVMFLTPAVSPEKATDPADSCKRLPQTCSDAATRTASMSTAEERKESAEYPVARSCLSSNDCW